MCLGIAEIDRQHEELVKLLNRLFVSVVERDKEAITIQSLDALLDYTRTHFVLEEQLMQQSRFDPEEFAAHRKEHLNFIDHVSRTAHKNLAEGKSVSFELIHFLKRWLRDHILITDRKYAASVIDSGLAGVLSALPENTSPETPDSAKARPWWKLW